MLCVQRIWCSIHFISNVTENLIIPILHKWRLDKQSNTSHSSKHPFPLILYIRKIKHTVRSGSNMNFTGDTIDEIVFHESENYIWFPVLEVHTYFQLVSVFLFMTN